MRTGQGARVGTTSGRTGSCRSVCHQAGDVGDTWVMGGRNCSVPPHQTSLRGVIDPLYSSACLCHHMAELEERGSSPLSPLLSRSPKHPEGAGRGIPAYPTVCRRTSGRLSFHCHCTGRHRTSCYAPTMRYHGAAGLPEADDLGERACRTVFQGARGIAERTFAGKVGHGGRAKA